MPYLRINNKVINTPLLEIVKTIQSQIYNGKLKIIKNRGDNIRVTCPFHKGGLENRASADIYIGDKTDILDYGWFKCFTCGEQGPFYKFVAECFDISETSAKHWLIENFADSEIEYTVDLPPMDFSKKKTEFIPEAILETFESFHPYMIQRKLSKRIIEVFEVKYDSNTKCLVFPVRDEFGRLVSLIRRSVEDKTFIIEKDTEKPLYLMHYMKKNNIQKCMITEGPIDALTACTYGFPCIATLGAISEHQIDLINKSSIRVLYTMFDNDVAGKRFEQKLMNKIRKDILVIHVPIPFANKKDINDLSQEEFDYCVNLAEQAF